ncbi:MAG: PhoH family protein, partial [Bacteroidales bacterium]
MIDTTIYLEGVDPIDFFGVNNVRFEKIKQNFPKLKIVSRGNEIKIKGEQEEIERFREKMDILIDYLNRFNDISPDDLDDILGEDTE